MKVRDLIETVWPVNGGPDLSLVFELEEDEQLAIKHYLEKHDGPGVDLALYCAAERLAERGIPQGITQLVHDKLVRLGRVTEAAMLEPFPCPQSKVAS